VDKQTTNNNNNMQNNIQNNNIVDEYEQFVEIDIDIHFKPHLPIDQKKISIKVPYKMKNQSKSEQTYIFNKILNEPLKNNTLINKFQDNFNIKHKIILVTMISCTIMTYTLYILYGSNNT
jgi:hypothetical protein